MKCAECGNVFSLIYRNATDYAYKTTTKGKKVYFCSYHCYNAYLNRVEEKKKEMIDYEEYTNNRKRIIAVDFDNTLCIKGKPNKSLFATIINRNEDIDFVLWTSREGKELEEAVKFCTENGWIPKYVNENVNKELPDCRKIFADYYIDDLSVYADDEQFFDTIVNNIGLLIKQ